MTQTGDERHLVAQMHLLRPRDLAEHRVPRGALRPLLGCGEITRLARGLYAPAAADVTQQFSLAVAYKKVPRGVICLLSALRFHDLGRQNPHEIWLAIDRKAHRPSAGSVPLRIVRFSGVALREGVETHVMERLPVRVLSPAKTVADCFKYRNELGLDVALEALREGWRAGRFSMDEVWRVAKPCRVANVMRPYLEALE